MYIPQIFCESRLDVLYEFMREHPFAILVSQSELGLDANHLPFELEITAQGQAVLLAHIARQNPLHQQVVDGSEVLLIFQAHNAYISPNWYPSKVIHHEHVPTWNYQVVHARGKIKFLEDEKHLRGILAKLTRTHEASQAQPWRMSDAPPAYIQAELAHIVGLQIEIEHVIGKFKLSQNRDKLDLLGAVEGLLTQGHTELAQQMQQIASSKL